MTIGHPDWAAETAERPSEVIGARRERTTAGQTIITFGPPAGERFRILGFRSGLAVSMHAAAADYSAAQVLVTWFNATVGTHFHHATVHAAAVDGGADAHAADSGWVRIGGPGVIFLADEDIQINFDVVDQGGTVWQSLFAEMTVGVVVVEEVP